MARETKTLQCYPSDSAINETCREQESFGWELINNQRCQEQNHYGDYVRTSTFNKLTFSREKNSPWYSEVTQLENRYNAIMDSEPRNRASKPGILGPFFGAIGVILGALLLFIVVTIQFWFFVWAPAILLIIGIILLAVYIVKKKRYKRDCADYQSRISEWKRTKGQEAEEVRQKAAAIVNQ